MKTIAWPIACMELKLGMVKKVITDFEMTAFRRVMSIHSIDWKEHRTNASVMEELGITNKRLYLVLQRSKSKYFGHILSAGNLCMTMYCTVYVVELATRRR